MERDRLSIKFVYKNENFLWAPPKMRKDAGSFCSLLKISNMVWNPELRYELPWLLHSQELPFNRVQTMLCERGNHAIRTWYNIPSSWLPT